MRTIVLRDFNHELVAAFRSQQVDMHADMAGAPPGVLRWCARCFSFATMDENTMTFTEDVDIMLADGITATRIIGEELAAIPRFAPVNS